LSLPEPKSIKAIARLFSTNRLLDPERDWLARAQYVERPFRRLLNGQSVPYSSRYYDQLSLHLLYRSLHQANEACNKLWTTIELYKHAKEDELLCNQFSFNFLGSSSIPTLHYANCSALISLMSLFGVGSFVTRTPTLEFFNVIRTANEFALNRRDDYLRSLLGHRPRGWHWQVLETYRGLREHGVEMPMVDIESCRTLLIARNRCHYDVLGHTTMREVFGFEEYFGFLPTVIASVSKAIDSLCEVLGTLPNHCDKRFQALRIVIPHLFALFQRRFISEV